MKQPYNHIQYWQEIKDKADRGNLTAKEYEDLLSKADWFYYMSDQNLSPLEMQTLRDIAEQGTNEFKSLYNREHAKRFNNESFYPKERGESYGYPYPEIKPASEKISEKSID